MCWTWEWARTLEKPCERDHFKCALPESHLARLSWSGITWFTDIFLVTYRSEIALWLLLRWWSCLGQCGYPHLWSPLLLLFVLLDPKVFIIFHCADKKILKTISKVKGICTGLPKVQAKSSGSWTVIGIAQNGHWPDKKSKLLISWNRPTIKYHIPLYLKTKKHIFMFWTFQNLSPISLNISWLSIGPMEVVYWVPVVICFSPKRKKNRTRPKIRYGLRTDLDQPYLRSSHNNFFD